MPLPLLLAPLAGLIAKGAAMAAPWIAKGAALGAKALGAAKAIGASIIKPVVSVGSTIMKAAKPLGSLLSTGGKLYTAGETVASVVDALRPQPQEEMNEEGPPQLVEGS